MEAATPIREGEPLLLWHSADDAVVLRAVRGPQTLEGRGVVDLTAAIGAPPGVEVEWAGRRYRAVRPHLDDLTARLHRKAQIVTSKDAPRLLRMAGVAPGATVLEAGAGSGALTLALAVAVGPEGRVISYERRPDFLEVARANVRLGGLEGRVEFRHRDVVAEGFDTAPVASIVLDLPEPWGAFPSARSTLVAGGGLGVFTPTYNQLERSVRELRTLGFVDVHSLELLERDLHVGEGGTRPEFEMLGHTGFLTGGRWMGPPW
jgi:tRNA (adenine57-N1/adenine58-N1)-methyltransferase catalytic subunit